MKTRAQITFTAKFESVASKFFIEAKGYQLPNGYIATKKLTKDSDGDFKYSSQWAIYDQRSGALIASGETPTFLLDRTATPAQLLNKLRPSRVAKQVQAKRETLEPAETPKYFALGKLAPLPKPQKPKSTEGYSLFTQLVSEIKAALPHAQNRYANRNCELLTFRIQRTMYRVKNATDTLTSFLEKITRNRKFLSDEILTSPMAVYTPAMQEHCQKTFVNQCKSWLEASRNMPPVIRCEPLAPTEAPKTETPVIAKTEAVKPAKKAVKTCSKPKWSNGLTKSVQSLIRQRQRHLSAFQCGKLDENLTAKYEKMGLIDLGKNQITKRGQSLLSA